MKEYEIYRTSGYMDIVDVIHARSYEEAVKKARKMGYGKGFRIEQVEEFGDFENYGPFAKKED